MMMRRTGLNQLSMIMMMMMRMMMRMMMIIIIIIGTNQKVGKR
jgi:hypothetical protein